ncbi:ATP-binding SpoIIE family protein phosphatase [Pseudonocardia lacus]|uniref:ATP-binding SpoIIE family protein phosphatase n=1 Tax=Pseudonocardia lacus TaxID=2835865 RepID=UPI001BDD3FDF|nr:ATP-binding SpoIIE family protein phosphatase [Pseudonocardia lacus]
MVEVTAATGPPSTAEDVQWLRVDDLSAAGTVRRAAEGLAAVLGFPPARAAELGLAATEIATNVVRHAGGGSVLLRSLRGARTTAVELLAVDRGPGMVDVAAASRDGHTTAGTLGIGLGAIVRLADDLEIFSPAGVGTVLVARFDADRRVPTPADPTAAGLTRPITGETACGDAYLIRHDGERTLLLMCDGLGHGPIAAAASQRAVAALRGQPWPVGPDRAVATLHAALSGTRGAALAVAELDPVAGVVRLCGVGNIAAAVVHREAKRSAVSMPGVAGVRMRAVRTFEYPLPEGALVVLHSDGLTGRWGPSRIDGLFTRSPLVVAAALLAEAGIRHDDAGVVVARARA